MQFICHTILVAVAVGVTSVNTVIAFARKDWWTKPISEDLYTAGRLTDTQVKYAAEAGFRSLISLVYFATDDNQGSEIYPSTANEEDIATRLSGMYYGLVPPYGGSVDYTDISTIERFTSLMAEAPRPVLFHCSSSYTATYDALAFLANQTAFSDTFEPRVNSSEFYRMAASTGHYYDSTAERTTVALLTGEDIVSSPPKPDVTVDNWNVYYWLLKPVYRNWYIAGQIQENYLEDLSSVFNVIINARTTVTTPPNDQPSQEEVTLLNIMDNTGTYNGSGRQSEQRLLETRLDPSLPNDYISPESPTNYASRNPLQFGDDIGYNETTERLLLGPPFIYYSTPIEGEYGYDLTMWEAYRDTWMTAGSHQAVLVHCRIGWRAGVAALLSAGYQYGLNSDWAIQRSMELGYFYSPDIYQLFREVLG